MARKATLTLAASNQAKVEDATAQGVALALVDVFVRGNNSVDDASKALEQAKLGLLGAVVQVLTGVPAITREYFDAHYKEPINKALEASGKYSTKMSQGAAASSLKTCMVGLTNGVEPKAEETFRTYVQRARDVLSKKGLWEKAHSSANAKGKGKKQTASASKPVDTSTGEKGKNPRQAAAFLLAGDDNKRRAVAIMFVLGDDKRAKAFDDWAAELQAEEAFGED